jgi:hypothetical protein
VNLAYQGVFLAAGIVVILAAARIKESRAPLPDFPHAWKLLFAIIFLAFGTFYFINALAPEISPDGTTYHLGLVARYLRQHGLGRITTSMYANLSEGLEMLFIPAFAFGRHSAAALIEFGCFLVIPLAIISYARRFGFATAGVGAAVMIVCSPIFGIDGVSAYNDCGAVLILFCLFYVLQIWDETRQLGLLVVAGLLAGFGYGIKYTLFLATPFCLVFVFWKLLRARQPFFKPLLVTGLCALLLIAPWWIKNWVIVGNPLSPFANQIFPNAYTTVRFETDYVALQKSRLSLPERVRDATIHGGIGGGFLGVLFLLSPLGLLALRYKQGRQILLTAAVFLLPAYANGQNRFLMLAAPFVAIALCLAVWKARGALLIVTLMAPILAFPAVADIYCDSWAWRPIAFPLADALRLVDERTSLEHRLPRYRTAELVNREVPANGKVFAMSAPQDAYIDADVVVSFQSAEGSNLRDLLWTASRLDFQPSWILTFHFPSQLLHGIRVEEMASGSLDDEWTVGEVRFSDAGNAVLPRQSWRLEANTNPWDLHFAFDNNPATRWGSRRTMTAGMWMGARFGQPLNLDTVELDCSHDQWAIRLKLEGLDQAGNWHALAAEPVKSERPVDRDLRRSALELFKQHGITHILLNKDDALLQDFEKYTNLWGVRRVGHEEDDWLYVIE